MKRITVPAVGLFFAATVVLSSLAAAQGHTFLWWADGYRGRSPEGPRLLMVQTSRYGAAFDVERAALARLGTLAAPLPYAEAAAQPNETVLGLSPESLRLSVALDGKEYVCARAARKTDDHANYPVRLIEGGRFLQRFDLLGLEFEDGKGERLDAVGRLEVCAWPEHMRMTLEITGEAVRDGALLRMELGGGGTPVRAEQAAAHPVKPPFRIGLALPGGGAPRYFRSGSASGASRSERMVSRASQYSFRARAPSAVMRKSVWGTRPLKDLSTSTYPAFSSLSMWLDRLPLVSPTVLSRKLKSASSTPDSSVRMRNRAGS